MKSVGVENSFNLNEPHTVKTEFKPEDMALPFTAEDNIKNELKTEEVSLQIHEIETCQENNTLSQNVTSDASIKRDAVHLQYIGIPKGNKCKLCDYSANSKHDLKYHFLIHKSNAKIFQCEHCSFVTRHQNVRDAHKLTHMKAEDIMWYDCRMCTFRTKFKGNLSKHELTHDNSEEQKKFKCADCPYRSMWKRDLERHQLKHKKPGEVPIYQCEHCFFKTKHQRYLKYHVQKVHIGEEYPEDQVFYCAQCSYSTRWKRVLKLHMIIHRERNMIYHCTYCPYVTDLQTTLRKHMKRHTKIFKCDKCDFSTNLKRFLKQHILGHNPVDQPIIYHCSKCPFKTSYKTSIVSHRLTHKSPDEIHMFECQYCNYKSKRSSDLKYHVRAIHTEDLPLIHCSQCDFTTRYKNNLKNHIKFFHTSEKDVLHRCEYCSVTSKYQSRLKNHVRMCHKETPKVKCKECGFQTHSVYLLTKHSVVHKNIDEVQIFKCGYCYTFETRYRRALVMHIKGHRPELKTLNEQKVFQCDKCDFTSKHKGYFNKHLAGHLNQIPTKTAERTTCKIFAEPLEEINESSANDCEKASLIKFEHTDNKGNLEISSSENIDDGNVEMSKSENVFNVLEEVKVERITFSTDVKEEE